MLGDQRLADSPGWWCGKLQRFGQRLQSFHRFLVRVANLLVLVSVHLAEGVAEGVFVCGCRLADHLCVALGWNLNRYLT